MLLSNWLLEYLSQSGKQLGFYTKKRIESEKVIVFLILRFYAVQLIIKIRHDALPDLMRLIPEGFEID